MPQTLKKIAMKIMKWMIAWKKYISQFQLFLLPTNIFELDGIISHAWKHNMAAKYSFKMDVSKVKFWVSLELNSLI